MNQFLKSKPTLFINLGLVLMIIGLFLFLLVRPIDVLAKFTIRTLEPGTPTYNPNSSLIFVSESDKSIEARGQTTRTLECHDDKGNYITVQIDSVPANRPVGSNPGTNNSVIVPDTTQFNGLPKRCVLIVAIFYSNVYLWRDHTETAKSNEFIVDLAELDLESIQRQIDELEKQRDAQISIQQPPTVIIQEGDQVIQKDDEDEAEAECGVSVVIINLCAGRP